MPQIGPAEILVVVLVGLLVFGPHRLPEVGRQVGRGWRELKKIQSAVKDEIDAVLDADGPASVSGDSVDSGDSRSRDSRIGDLLSGDRAPEPTEVR